MWYNNYMGKVKGTYYKSNTSTHKVCAKCNIKKERSEFHKDSARADGITAYCKQCKLAINNKWRGYNPEEMKQSQRRTRRKREYGVTAEEYDQMLEDQENKCHICKSEIGYEAAVDHDHLTGIVRGLLCRNCNVGLGHFKDSIETLKSAVEYLSKYM